MSNFEPSPIENESKCRPLLDIERRIVVFGFLGTGVLTAFWRAAAETTKSSTDYVDFRGAHELRANSDEKQFRANRGREFQYRDNGNRRGGPSR